MPWKGRRRQDADIPPGIQIEQVRVTAHEQRRAGHSRQFQIHVVLLIPAVRDLFDRLDPSCRHLDQFKDRLAPFDRKGTRKLRTTQDGTIFIDDLARYGQDAPFNRRQQCCLWHAVGPERGANQRRSIEDDYQSRRSAL